LQIFAVESINRRVWVYKVSCFFIMCVRSNVKLWLQRCCDFSHVLCKRYVLLCVPCVLQYCVVNCHWRWRDMWTSWTVPTWRGQRERNGRIQVSLHGCDELEC